MTASSERDPLVPEPMRIVKVKREIKDTFTLELDASGRPDGFPFAPGQFNMLYVFGAGEVPISMSGDPGNPEILVHTIRAVGTVTEPMKRLKQSDFVGVRGPYGSTWPVEEARGHDLFIIAGGLGLAPLRPAIYHVLAHRPAYRRVVILYGARSPTDLLYRKECRSWRGRFDVEVEVTVDHADSSYRGHVGVVPALLARTPIDTARTVAMVCGPEVMMRFTARDLLAKGLLPSQIYLSMERNMKCAVGLCGHCQFGPTFVCKDGPVYRLDSIAWLFGKREI